MKINFMEGITNLIIRLKYFIVISSAIDSVKANLKNDLVIFYVGLKLNTYYFTYK